jgi:hypothetical protein
MLREISLMPQPSPPCGDARRGMALHDKFIHTFIDRAYSSLKAGFAILRAKP